MHIKSKFLTGSFLLVGVCSMVLAGDFSGKIIYSGDGTPGATLSLEQGGTSVSTISGKNGVFKFTVAGGTYNLKITFSGFQNIEESITIDGSGLNRDFSLEPDLYEQMTVISSSKVETRLIDSPATISVITPAQIENSANNDFGDMLQELPGVNVVKFSARDINIVTREDSQSLANSQLTLLDGRSIYLDFFGIVLWDFMPTNMDEIKQIEVINGPASAIWGANAQTGLVNIITKSPRELIGTTLSMNAGSFNRDIEGSDQGNGSSYGINLTHAGLIGDKYAYKISLGYFNSDAWARPTGLVPIDLERGTGGTEYPNFKNKGADQPKIDIRLDQDLANGGQITYGLGSARTEGIIHSGIGPFDIQSGSELSYGKVVYTKDDLNVKFFANFLDGDSENLLTRDLFGNPIGFGFATDTYHLEIGHASSIGDNHHLAYGASARHNEFALTLAPGENKRDEFGAYVQDEITYENFRAVLGIRLDKFSSIDDVIASPRLSLMWQPTDRQSVRVSYNEAFRSPSLIENFLDITFFSAIFNPSSFGVEGYPDIPIVTRAQGNANLKEDSVTAYEIGYTGVFDNTIVTFSAYRNDTDQNLTFLVPPGGVYTSDDPPPGWYLDPSFLDVLAGVNVFFPKTFTYLNLGPVRYEGMEFSVTHSFNKRWSSAFNYSWQDDPKILADANPYPEEELSNVPSYRFNLGLHYAGMRSFGSLGVTHNEDFFSTDVLDSRFHGSVPSYNMINLNLGYKWMDNRVVGNLKINNVANKEIQQHIFADIMKRSIVAELKLHF